jgi:hypothetical protein
VWWDANPLRELLDGTTITRWRYDLPTPRRETVLSLSGSSSNNGSKANPAISGDILGDWREEVVVRSSDNQSLRIYTTTIPAASRMFTLMHDSAYRVAMAWQNVAYNQPPHPSFYLGDGMTTPPQPQIYFGGELTGDYNKDGTVDGADYVVWRKLAGTPNFIADGDHDTVVGPGDYTAWQRNFGDVESLGSGGAAVAGSAAEPLFEAAPLATDAKPSAASAAIGIEPALSTTGWRRGVTPAALDSAIAIHRNDLLNLLNTASRRKVDETTYPAIAAEKVHRQRGPSVDLDALTAAAVELWALEFKGLN